MRDVTQVKLAIDAARASLASADVRLKDAYVLLSSGDAREMRKKPSLRTPKAKAGRTMSAHEWRARYGKGRKAGRR